MTTVAALARDGHVWMAADSQNNVYDRPIIDGAVKIRRVNMWDDNWHGEILIGVCGNGCLAPLMRHLKVDYLPDDADDATAQIWADVVASAITEIAHDHHVLNSDGEMDGTLLLGAAGRVWTLTDHQAIPHSDGIAAIGSGEGPAIGAIDAQLPHYRRRYVTASSTCAPDNWQLADDDGERIVRTAIEIACHRDTHTAPPIQLEHLGGT